MIQMKCNFVVRMFDSNQCLICLTPFNVTQSHSTSFKGVAKRVKYCKFNNDEQCWISISDPMTCVHFDRAQICTQVDASFSSFGHPTQVTASWSQCCFPLCERTRKAARKWQIVLNLRALAGPFGQVFLVYEYSPANCRPLWSLSLYVVWCVAGVKKHNISVKQVLS